MFNAKQDIANQPELELESLSKMARVLELELQEERAEGEIVEGGRGKRGREVKWDGIRYPAC